MTCRDAILATMLDLETQTGRGSFGLQEIVDAVLERTSEFPASTIRTHVADMLFVDPPSAPTDGGAARDRYRLRAPAHGPIERYAETSPAAPHPTPDARRPHRDVHVAIAYRWHPVGEITLVAEQLSLPRAPSVPGLLRVMIGRTAYVGATRHLGRRFDRIARPAPGQPGDHRLTAWVAEAIRSGARADIAVVTTAEVTHDGASTPLDLGDRAARRLAEGAALVRLVAEGVDILRG